MNKNLLLYILLLFLIVVNGFFLFNYIGNNRADTKSISPQRPEVFIIKELGFNKVQQEEFKNLNNVHHEKMKRISEGIMELKDVLFDGVDTNLLNDKEVDSVALLIGRKEAEKDVEMFYLFKRIQEICNANQKQKFNKIIKDARQMGEGREQGPPRPNTRNMESPRPPRPDGEPREGHPPPRH